MVDTISQFKKKLIFNHLDCLMPYGFILMSHPENMNSKQETVKQEADVLMSYVNEIHKSLLNGNWESIYIEFLNQFENPVEVVFNVYKEMQQKTGAVELDMAQTLKYALNESDYCKDILGDKSKKETRSE
jgi:hypothetical protein